MGCRAAKLQAVLYVSKRVLIHTVPYFVRTYVICTYVVVLQEFEQEASQRAGRIFFDSHAARIEAKKVRPAHSDKFTPAGMHAEAQKSVWNPAVFDMLVRNKILLSAVFLENTFVLP